MTLAQRLLVAIGIVTILTTTALGFGVREAWRRTEEETFADQFEQATARLEQELDQEIRALPALLQPLCDHDPVLDSVLVDLQAGRLDAGQRLALSLRVPELMKAFRLDELTLVTDDGVVLGSGHEPGRMGARDPDLGRRIDDPSGAARLRTATTPVALEAHCKRTSGSATVGLVGARHFESLLVQVGQGHGLSLSLHPPPPSSPLMTRSVELPELGGVDIVATRSRIPLFRALARLDATILAVGGATFGLALALAMLLARGLARPIVALSQQARAVVSGEPKRVEGRGGRELADLADAFNQAIADLVDLRKRLAATERIAARREIARRVAHEIKNPLAPIRAAVETLRRLRARGDPAFDEYFDEAAKTVLDEVTRIANIVQQFTRFARLPPPNPAPFDLGQAIREVVSLHAAGGTPIDLEISDLPTVVADRDQVVQVLTNLLQNANDAIEGRRDPKVRVLAGLGDERHVEIRVEDNGPGVSAEMQERLFEPYATTKDHGTGLGLAICQRIAVEHGGAIEYTETPAGGATFILRLPVAGPTLLPEPPPAA